ncbi:hypothetical protein E2562_021721 [Oryza meyeriana var. granulata]|uniref:Uncharacterized protein n=1 Tax=Oryza meyeriana var. granulata TaxID=110450 RepID=A0A6G1DZS7_9ORYZ|nr:hypothetical protein E2562_021721 [Oryza meyeriana var. granulata]
MQRRTAGGNDDEVGNKATSATTFSLPHDGKGKLGSSAARTPSQGPRPRSSSPSMPACFRLTLGRRRLPLYWS